MEVYNIVQEVGSKLFSKKKECKKAKWLSEEALQIAEKRSERQRRKGNAKFKRIARRDKNAFLSEQGTEIEENNRMEKTRGQEDWRCPGNIFYKDGHNKGQKWQEPNRSRN